MKSVSKKKIKVKLWTKLAYVNSGYSLPVVSIFLDQGQLLVPEGSATALSLELISREQDHVLGHRSLVLVRVLVDEEVLQVEFLPDVREHVVDSPPSLLASGQAAGVHRLIVRVGMPRPKLGH